MSFAVVGMIFYLTDFKNFLHFETEVMNLHFTCVAGYSLLTNFSLWNRVCFLMLCVHMTDTSQGKPFS